MTAGISLKTVPHALKSGAQLTTVVALLHEEDGWALFELLSARRSSLEYTNLSIAREMPALFQVLRDANNASIGAVHYGMWVEGVLSAYLHLRWDPRAIGDSDVPEIEFAVSEIGSALGIDDLVLELGIQMCRDYGFSSAQAIISVKTAPSQHCFFRHGFRPLVYENPEADEWGIMVCPFKEVRGDLTFVQYARDVTRMKKNMEAKYGQQFSDEFIADFAGFVNTYVMGSVGK